MPRNTMNILAIGGSDPSSGAGVQSDIRAAAALGDHCFGVITAVTSQNSSRFFAAEPVSAGMIQKQIDSILSDFAVNVISIGMVYDSSTIRVIRSSLKNLGIPIIIDPVITSTTGGTLLRKSAFADFKKMLVPLAHTITPNVREAEMLSGARIRNLDGLRKGAERIVALGAENVVITGHRFVKNKVSDFVYGGGEVRSIPGRIVLGQNHGSGCNFSIALAHQVARKSSLIDAVRFAKKFTIDAIESAQKIGRGASITRPKMDAVKSELYSAILKFQMMEGAAHLIPEVQTNFVFARKDPKKITDVVGVRGRIVKTGDSVTMAGDLEYGGSRHVATAILTVQKKFRQTRSAINVKFDEKTIRKMRESNYMVLNYDRRKEPQRSKSRENSTIMWGIADAIKNTKFPPDAVYHKGDVGKEPMIIMFGTSPSDVLEKIKSIT